MHRPLGAEITQEPLHGGHRRVATDEAHSQRGSGHGVPGFGEVNGGFPAAVEHESGEQRALEAKQAVRLTPPGHPVRDGKAALGSKPDADQALVGTQNAGSRFVEAGSEQGPGPAEEVVRDDRLELDAAIGIDGERADHGRPIPRAPDEGDIAIAELALQARQDFCGTFRPGIATEAGQKLGQVRAATRDNLASRPPPLRPPIAEILDPRSQGGALKAFELGEHVFQGGGPRHQPEPNRPGGLRGLGFAGDENRGDEQSRESANCGRAGPGQRASK